MTAPFQEGQPSLPPGVLVIEWGAQLEGARQRPLNEDRTEFPLTTPVVRVGRLGDLELSFPDYSLGVSRRQATIQAEGGQWFISDDNSRNGTLVNGKPADHTPLFDGDEIQFGLVQCRFWTSLSNASDSNLSGTAEIERLDRFNSPTGERPVLGGNQLSCLIDVANVYDADELLSVGRMRPPRRDDGAFQMDAEMAWAIGFFSEIGRALLVSHDVDEMLENVMIEAFKRVPAERGLISLVDEDSGKLVPKVVRSDQGDSPIQTSSSIVEAVMKSKSAVLVEDTSADARFGAAASILHQRISSAICVPLYADASVRGIVYVDTQTADVKFTVQHLELLTVLGLFSAVAIQQAALRDRALAEERKRERLARYSSPAVIERVIASQDADGEMLADTADVSVLFADLKGFTAMSERIAPQDVVNRLNAIFTRLASAVFEFNGTLDKFMGDGMLAFFGAPLHVETHAECAIRAAIRMQADIDDFNANCPPDDRIGLRIGINTGTAIVGDIGSVERKDYTVIGDTVNVASRFESSVAKVGDIVVGARTRESTTSFFEFEELEPVRLKGKAALVQAYRVVREQAT